MGKMTGEIVGTELIFRIETVGLQIVCPLGQLRPILLSEMPIALCTTKRIHKDQHVSALLNGHLIFFGQFPSTVHLSISERIRAQIMRRERPAPSWKRRIFEHWL